MQRQVLNLPLLGDNIIYQAAIFFTTFCQDSYNITPMNDAAKKTIKLVLDAQRGDEKALNQLYNRYLERVHRIVRLHLGRKLRSKLDSMDIVQDVMIRVLKDFKNFKPDKDTAFVNWITRMVVNEIKDKARYFGAEKRRLSREEALEYTDKEGQMVEKQIPAKTTSPTRKLLLKEEYRNFEEALDQLPAKQKDIIILRNLNEMSFKEIADQMDSTEDAARMAYVRGIDRLTDIMTKSGRVV